MNASSVITVADKEDSLSTWDAAPFLRKVTELIPNVIYIFNQQTQSNEYANRSLGESVGYSEAEVQAMGDAMMPQIIHPKDLPRIYAHFGQIKSLADGEVAELEYRVRHRDGSWVWLQSKDTVFARDSDGAVLRHIGVASDVTPLKQAEFLALERQRQLEATNAELRRFAYSVTHDLKAPSNSLQLILNELLACHGDTLNADAMGLVDLALKTSKGMGRLVEDVQEYTQVVEHALTPEPTDLNAVLATVQEMLEADIGETGATINLGHLPIVRADRGQMRILFRHLLHNALKSGTEGTAPLIDVSARDLPDTNLVEVTVQDHGIGISGGDQQRIFELFRKLDTGCYAGGTGLGLPICKRIALNHGSEIELNSEVGAGASFSIRLTAAT